MGEQLFFPQEDVEIIYYFKISQICLISVVKPLEILGRNQVYSRLNEWSSDDNFRQSTDWSMY